MGLGCDRRTDAAELRFANSEVARLTAERDAAIETRDEWMAVGNAAIRERDAARGEASKQRIACEAMKTSLQQAIHERDAARQRLAKAEQELGQAKEELSCLRRSWVDPIERKEFAKQIAAELRGSFDACDKAEVLVGMFELYFGQQAGTSRVMRSIQDAGWDVDGDETAWEYVSRLHRMAHAPICVSKEDGELSECCGICGDTVEEGPHEWKTCADRLHESEVAAINRSIDVEMERDEAIEKLAEAREMIRGLVGLAESGEMRHWQAYCAMADGIARALGEK